MISDAETSDLKISPSLPISELIKLIRCSFLESEVNEVREILIDRENSMKSKLENLVKDRDLLKDEVRLLERALSSSARDKFKFEEKWQQTQRECEELKERNVKLIENQTVLMSNRGKREGGEWYLKLCEENSEMARSRMLSVLKKENDELKCKHLESDRMVEEYKEKHKRLEMRFVQMYKEMEGLRQEKAVADQTVDELRRRELEANKNVDELKRQIIEANLTMEELRLKKYESDKAAELNKKILENLTPRISKVEEAFATILNLNVEDLANIVKDNETRAGLEEAKHVNLPESEDKEESLGNGSARGGEYADDGNDLGISPGVHSTCNSTGIGCSGLSKKGGENSELSFRTKVDEADGFQISPGAHSGYHPPQGETNDTDQEHESKGLWGPGTRGTGLGSDNKVPMSKAGCSGKMLHPSPVTGVIIEISDSDDECNPGGGACTVDVQSDVGVREMIYGKLVQASSSQANKRNKTDWIDSSLMSLSPKRKRNAHGSDHDNLPIHRQKEKKVIESTHDRLISLDNDFSVKSSRPHHALASTRASDSQTPLQKRGGFTDGVSTDSEGESCSDSYMEDSCRDEHVAKLCSQKLSRKWICRADMLKAFQEDAELCMNAVCALHRQQFVTEKSALDSNMCEGGGFSHIDALRGSNLAKYLIDGDPELRLRKSVSEVQQQRPDVISQCKKLANIYQVRLFEIYSNAKDPFFR